ncbi:MAG: glycosyltransferase family 39 protein [Elusimicrobiota bacterium]
MGRRWIFWAAWILFFLYSFWMLDKFPVAFVDDVIFTEPSLTFLRQGHFGSTVMPPIYGLDQTNVVYGRIFFLINSAIFALLGYNLFTIRLLPFMAGVWLFCLTYKMGRRLFNPPVACWAATLLALSHNFFLASHIGRPDVLVACLVMLTSHLGLNAVESGKTRTFFWSALTASLSLDTLPTGLVATALLGAIFLYHRQSCRRRAMLAATGGFLLGCLWWISVHVLVNRQLYFFQWENFWIKEAGRGLTFLQYGPFAAIWGETQRYVKYFWEARFHRNMLIFALLALSWIFLGYHARKNRGAKILLVLSFAGMLAQSSLANKSSAYIISLLPFWMLALAAFLSNGDWMIDPKQTRLRLFKMAGLSALLLLGVMEHAYLWQYRHASYERYINALKEKLPRQAMVLAGAAFWPGLKDRSVISDYWLHSLHADGPQNRQKLGANFAEFISKYSVTHIVTDADAGWSIRKHPEHGYEEFFKTSCRLIAEIQDPFYGCTWASYRTTKKCVTKIYEVTGR